MANKKLKVGIIGGSVRNGWAKMTHIPAVQQLPSHELSAVCTSNQKSAEESAREFQAPHAFMDAKELANHSDVDLVVVSVKARDHYEAIEAAVAAEKAVYCEWPWESIVKKPFSYNKWQSLKMFRLRLACRRDKHLLFNI